MTPVIQEVLAVYDRWDGSLERQYIAAQQKPAPAPDIQGPRMHGTLSPKPRKTKIRGRVVEAFEDGGWMSSHDVAVVTGIDWRQVRQALCYLVRSGVLEVKRGDGRGNYAEPQQYRVKA